MRSLVSEAGTIDKEEKVIMINGVARAFFEAKATRKVCIELPEDDKVLEDVKNDNVGLLKMSLYGTRDAATNWQEEVAKEMISWGFSRGRYNPCRYYHKGTHLKCLVNGDDFVSVGSRRSVEKFRQKLEKRFEIKTKIIGTTDSESSEGKVLNRVIRETEDGWEYEPDQRHAEIIISELGLQDARPAATPGEEVGRRREQDESKQRDVQQIPQHIS